MTATIRPSSAGREAGCGAGRLSAMLLCCLWACTIDTPIAEPHPEPPANVPGNAGTSGSTVGKDAAAPEPAMDSAVLEVDAGDAGTLDAGQTSSGPVTSLPPEPCFEGDLVVAPDGCNPCECIGGGWACFQRDCDSIPVSCTAGDTRIAGDGCNECLCDATRGWMCSDHVLCDDLPGGELCFPDEVLEFFSCTCTCVKGSFECTCSSWDELGCPAGPPVVDFDACNICECDPALNWVCSNFSWCG